jgi:hypothetical protein
MSRHTEDLDELQGIAQMLCDFVVGLVDQAEPLDDQAVLDRWEAIEVGLLEETEEWKRPLRALLAEQSPTWGMLPPGAQRTVLAIMGEEFTARMASALA